MSSRKVVLFASRGRGRGHAVPDIAIADKLVALDSSLALYFASYASGADVYRAYGLPVIDLKCPENPDLRYLVRVYTDLLRQLRPDIIIAHEEIGLLLAAKNAPAHRIFLTDFFGGKGSLLMDIVSRHATTIIFLGQPGVFEEPESLRGKVHYVGWAVRPLGYSDTDRLRARDEIGIRSDSFVCLVQPGSWRERSFPIVTHVTDAWRQIPPPKHMFWITGADYLYLSGDPRINRNDCTVLHQEWNIGRLIAASNVVITKSNRLTVFEAAALGRPSISITASLNWADDAAIKAIPSNHSINIGELDSAYLGALLLSCADKFPRPVTSEGIAGAAAVIAEAIATCS